MLTRTFKIPRDMSPEEVADIFAAYRLGARAFLRRGAHKLPDEPRPYGPYRDPNDDMRWQLDGSNDFWLIFDRDGRARLGCRIEYYLKECKSMVRLFELQYPVSE